MTDQSQGIATELVPGFCSFHFFEERDETKRESTLGTRRDRN